MGKSAPAPPPAPDYAGAAQAQGQANLQSGVQTASLSNPNIISPYGNQTVTWDTTGPNGDPQATVTQTLTPDAQAAVSAQQRTQAALGGLAQQGIGQAQDILGRPFQYTGPGVQTSFNAGQPVSAGPALSAGPQAQGQLDLSGVAAMPVNAGTTGQQAIMARLQPQIQQSNAALQQQLANQGIAPGTEAYNNAMRVQGQQNNDLLSQAALQGIGLDMSANQQGFGQAAQQAGLYNQALAQNFGQQSQAAAQNYSQALGAQNQNYNQALQGAQFGNTAAAQALQQQLGLYNVPLNEITALMSGSQIQNPQFQQYSGANVAAAPIFQGTQAAGQFAQDVYGQQMAGYNAQMGALGEAVGGLMGAGGKLGAAWIGSDVRLKSNIVRVGTHPLGIGIYDFDMAGKRMRGVMAHEVERVKPDAVRVMPNGFKAVNYGAL